MEVTETRLNEYVGSKEENLLKTGLSVHPPDFMILVFENCNASKCVPFSSADVTLKQYQSYRKKLWDWHDDYFVKASYDQLFNFELITNLARDGLSAASSEYKKTLLQLMDFFRDIYHHQEALSRLRQSHLSKSELTAAVAVHLLSQLTIDCKYELDDYPSPAPEVCPCGLQSCMKPLYFNCTAIGTNDTWHGRADLILNQQIPVFMLQKDTDNLLEEDLPASTSTPEVSAQDDNSHSNHPPVKKVKLSDNDSENVTRKEPIKKEDLIDVGVIDQIVALTITNSFTQISHSENLKGWLIPAFGCTSDHVIVFLYDCVNDILLQSLEIMPFWLDDEDGTFHPNTIVVLWMLINFQLFTRPELGKKIVCNKAAFFQCTQGSLTSYRNIRKTTAFKSFDHSDHYLSYFRQRVERARDKQPS